MNKLPFKQIKFRFSDWLEIYQLAQELQEERGSKTSLPSATAEAVKFFRENRQKKEVA